MAGHDELGALLEALTAALGGRAAIERVRSIAATADCMGPRGPYMTEICSARGGRLWFRQSWPDRAPFLAVVNGDHAWMRDEASGEVAPLDRVTVAMVRSHEFQLLPLELERRFHDLRLAGQEVFTGIPSHILQMQDELDMPCQAYLRLDDALLAGMRMADARRSGDAHVQVQLKAWETVENVRMPAEVVASDAGGDYTLRFQTIQLNAVDETLFDVPPELQTSSR
jgi:hypothetical protein